MKKFFLSLLTGALAFSLMVGCSSEGGESQDPAVPGGTETEAPAAPTTGGDMAPAPEAGETPDAGATDGADAGADAGADTGAEAGTEAEPTN